LAWLGLAWLGLAWLGFFTRVEQLTGSDLTPSSQEELLQKRVKYVGISYLMDLQQQTFCSFALLEEKELTIADPVFITSAYNEIYYIARTFSLQVYIKEDIFIDKTLNVFPD
jgi:hypothetical protein